MNTNAKYQLLRVMTIQFQILFQSPRDVLFQILFQLLLRHLLFQILFQMQKSQHQQRQRPRPFQNGGRTNYMLDLISTGTVSNVRVKTVRFQVHQGHSFLILETKRAVKKKGVIYILISMISRLFVSNYTTV